METIQETYNDYCSDYGVIDLVLDGGTKNNNEVLEEFISWRETQKNMSGRVSS